jgi:hypothetical protein
MGLDSGLYTVEVEKEGYVKQTAEEVQMKTPNKTVQDFELIQEE